MHTLLVLGGPTGSGKNRIALEIAKRIGVEIVNADSRQIYHGLAVGTNQPAASELRLVPHHLYGFLEPETQFSVADYERNAVSVIEDISGRGALPFLVGGTGFYIKAVLRGIWPVPEHDPNLRRRLRRIAAVRGKARLHALLRRIDPASASVIAVNDSYRVTRALEIYFQTGLRRSEIQQPEGERFHALKFYVDIDPARLALNIEIRTESMFQAGWVEEVEGLCSRYPHFESLPASRSLGYPEILQLLSGRISIDECKQLVVRRTIQYAKRQRTWFRNQDRFDRVSSAEELHKKLDSVLQ